MIISILLNIITLCVVGAFAMVLYMAYRKRPDLSHTPLQVLRDITVFPDKPGIVYDLVPFKKGLLGPVGEFGSYYEGEYSDLIGNSYTYKQGDVPFSKVKLS